MTNFDIRVLQYEGGADAQPPGILQDITGLDPSRFHLLEFWMALSTIDEGLTCTITGNVDGTEVFSQTFTTATGVLSYIQSANSLPVKPLSLTGTIFITYNCFGTVNGVSRIFIDDVTFSTFD